MAENILAAVVVQLIIGALGALVTFITMRVKIQVLEERLEREQVAAAGEVQRLEAALVRANVRLDDWIARQANHAR